MLLASLVLLVSLLLLRYDKQEGRWSLLLDPCCSVFRYPSVARILTFSVVFAVSDISAVAGVASDPGELALAGVHTNSNDKITYCYLNDNSFCHQLSEY
jgi:hypothetical protein